MKKIKIKNNGHTTYSDNWSYEFQNSKYYGNKTLYFIKNIIENIFKVKIIKKKKFWYNY